MHTITLIAICVGLVMVNLAILFLIGTLVTLKRAREMEEMAQRFARKYEENNEAVVEGCICCGAYVPEGRQICPICERQDDGR